MLLTVKYRTAKNGTDVYVNTRTDLSLYTNMEINPDNQDTAPDKYSVKKARISKISPICKTLSNIDPAKIKNVTTENFPNPVWGQSLNFIFFIPFYVRQLLF